jgi:adenylate cyclase
MSPQEQEIDRMMMTSAAARIAWPAYGDGDDSLARFVPPLLASNLAVDPAAFEAPRQSRVAVMFADIVGFTRLCEELPPAEAMALLDGFYRRTARKLAAYGAEIDDYIGDGVMAVWGCVQPSPTDALRAFRCAIAILEEIERWNGESGTRRAHPVHIGIGLHAGEAMIGNGGDSRRAKLVVLGDAVNVASRLERSTREHGASLIASDEFMRAACRGEPANVGLDRCRRRPVSLSVRGRRRPVPVWILRRPGP